MLSHGYDHESPPSCRSRCSTGTHASPQQGGLHSRHPCRSAPDRPEHRIPDHILGRDRSPGFHRLIPQRHPRTGSRSSSTERRRTTRPVHRPLHPEQDPAIFQPTCADLQGANLTGADLRGADLSGARMACIDLHGQILSAPYTRCTDLRNANLTDVNLTNADLRGADLRGVRYEGAIVTGAVTDPTTQGKWW
ncbi:pentapeptide repeat-containing protein [Saccharothrix carnea]|uniref:pentapeptide repeat-containing protein n=1 Tax=Saccharothrix carnea TaxID=1280637 RepID=UPI0018E9E6E5